jgi:transcriptional regulator with XRE-family HTH domain
MSTRSSIDLRSLLDASGIGLAELARDTGIDESTLSRIANGLQITSEKRQRIAAALAVAVERHAKEVRKARRVVAKIVETTQPTAA